MQNTLPSGYMAATWRQWGQLLYPLHSMLQQWWMHKKKTELSTALHCWDNQRVPGEKDKINHR